MCVCVCVCSVSPKGGGTRVLPPFPNCVSFDVVIGMLNLLCHPFLFLLGGNTVCVSVCVCVCVCLRVYVCVCVSVCMCVCVFVCVRI